MTDAHEWLLDDNDILSFSHIRFELPIQKPIAVASYFQLWAIWGSCYSVWQNRMLCQCFHLYGFFTYTLFEMVNACWNGISLWTLLYPKHRNLRLIGTTFDMAQGMLVGSAARILLCELYYGYSRLAPVALTSLSVAFALLSSGAQSWRRQQINREGFI